jgi:hypothetical protein
MFASYFLRKIKAKLKNQEEGTIKKSWQPMVKNNKKFNKCK